MKSLIAATSICLLSGCASIAQFGSPPSSGAQARVYGMGHTNRLPINAFVQLHQIEGESVKRSAVAYDMAAKQYNLYYRFVYITDAKIVVCPQGICEEATVNWVRHPYRISAALKAGYIYMPVLVSETRIEPELCLYGEPIGASGQRIVPVSSILVLSAGAEKIACGPIDKSITFVSKEGSVLPAK